MPRISRPNLKSLESVSHRLKKKKKGNERKLFWGERKKKALFLFQRSFPPQFRMFVLGALNLWRKKIKYSPLSRRCFGNDPHLLSLFHRFSAVVGCVFSQLTYLPCLLGFNPSTLRAHPGSMIAPLPHPHLHITGQSPFSCLSLWPQTVNSMRTKRFCH